MNVIHDISTTAALYMGCGGCCDEEFSDKPPQRTGETEQVLQKDLGLQLFVRIMQQVHVHVKHFSFCLKPHYYQTGGFRLIQKRVQAIKSPVTWYTCNQTWSRGWQNPLIRKGGWGWGRIGGKCEDIVLHEMSQKILFSKNLMMKGSLSWQLHLRIYLANVSIRYSSPLPQGKWS